MNAVITRRHLLVAGAGLGADLAGHAAPSAADVDSRLTRWRGRPLRGFTTGLLGQLDDPTLDALAATGARLVRVAMRWSVVGAELTVNSMDRAALGPVLDRAARRGLAAVVVAVVGQDDRAGGLWESAPLQAAFVQAWAALATDIGAHPAVAGLDLLNEPHPGGLIAEAQSRWRALAVRTIAAMRARGCAAPIVFEPVAGGNSIGLDGMEPLPAAGMVYSIHFYTPHDITHQQVSPAWPRRIPYPAGPEWGLGAWDPVLGVGRIDRQRLAQELRVTRAFQQRHSVPIFVGEFSCVRWAPGDSARRYVSDCIDIFDALGWSWCYHSFREWPGWDAEIASTDPDARERTPDAPVMQVLRRGFAA